MRWLGFPPSSDSWEPRSNLLADVPDMVKAYDAEANNVVSSEIANEVVNAFVNAVILDHELMVASADSYAVHVHSAQPMGAPHELWDTDRQRYGLVELREKVCFLSWDTGRPYCLVRKLESCRICRGEGRPSRDEWKSVLCPIPNEAEVAQSVVQGSIGEQMQSRIHQVTFGSRHE